MKRVAVLLLLLLLAIAVPAFARGSHSSRSHSRAARGVARNKHGHIKRPLPSTPSRGSTPAPRLGRHPALPRLHC